MSNEIVEINKYVQKRKRENMCAILEKINGKTASDLLTMYNIPMEAPIDIVGLLQNMGISTIAMDFSEIEDETHVARGSILGAAISNKDDLAIFYKKSDPYKRKVFTIAHELGHCCKHADNLRISHVELRTTDSIDDLHEREANIFAGELLIPQPLLEKKYKEFIIPSLKALSEIFNVSANVMAARLDYLKMDYYKDVELVSEV